MLMCSTNKLVTNYGEMKEQEIIENIQEGHGGAPQTKVLPSHCCRDLTYN